MAVQDWSAIADENTTIDGINIAEHCPAKNINNAIRAVMANVKAFSQTPADAAAKLTTARTITLSGDATGSVAFDGSADVSLPVSTIVEEVNGDASEWSGTTTKYSNGLAIFLGRYKMQKEYDGIVTFYITYPVPFFKIPYIFFCQDRQSMRDSYLYSFLINSYKYDRSELLTLCPVVYRNLSSYNETNKNDYFNVNIMAIGKWK